MKRFPFILVATLLILVASCGNNDSYNIPENYDFENVNYAGQTARIGMLEELKAYMQTTLSGNILDAGRLHGMYSNDPNLAIWEQNYDNSKQLRNKTNLTAQAVFDDLLTALSEDSQTPNSIASPGTAGISSSLDGNKSYFLNANGLEYTQVIEKGLMGACFYYQATGVYLEDEKMNQDNNTVTPGRGTEMEHAWDEAFGYLGVPLDFPINTNDLKFWGKYSNGRDAILGCNARLMDAFIEGRAAISHKDLENRDAAIASVRQTWEQVAVGSALHYLNSAATNYNDPALRCHALSEAVAFIHALQFNPDKLVSFNEIQLFLETIGGSSSFLEMDFYNTELQNIQSARDALASKYNLLGEVF